MKDAYDPDGEALSVSNLSVDESVGTISAPIVTGEGEGAITSWTFTPAADSSGDVTLTYDVTDGTMTTSTSATVHVNPVNDPPEAGDVSLSMDEDGELVITEAQLLAGASDVEGDTLSVTQVTFGGSPGEGQLEHVPGEMDPGPPPSMGPSTWKFTPGLNFNGELSLSYKISDGQLTTSTSAKITVNSINDLPVVSSPSLNVSEGETVTVTAGSLGVSDADDDGSAVTILSLIHI